MINMIFKFYFYALIIYRKDIMYLPTLTFKKNS